MKTDSIVDPRNWECYDPLMDEHSKRLYGKDGFTIFKGFADGPTVSRCLDLFRKIGEEEVSGTKMPLSESNEIQDVLDRILDTRVSTGLQPSADGFLFALGLWNGVLNGGAKRGRSDELARIKDALKRDGWSRFMCYKDVTNWSKHLDSAGEVQSILYLSERGVDFNSGGLRFADMYDEDVVDVCGMAKAGDLVLLNGTKKVHWVDHVRCDDEHQMGRVTLFVPGYPKFG